MADTIAGISAEIDPESTRSEADSDRIKTRILTELAGPRWIAEATIRRNAYRQNVPQWRRQLWTKWLELAYDRFGEPRP